MHVSSLLSTAGLLAMALATISGENPSCSCKASLLIHIIVTYNTAYNNKTSVFRELACWNKDTNTVLPGYDYIPFGIMGIDTITGPDSPLCATCWILEYGGNARPVLAVDSAKSGVVLSLEGMNSLTGGQAEKLGRVDADYLQVAPINCGLSDGPFEL